MDLYTPCPWKKGEYLTGPEVCECIRNRTTLITYVSLRQNHERSPMSGKKQFMSWKYSLHESRGQLITQIQFAKN